MDEFVLLAGTTRLLHGFMLVVGIALVVAAAALVRRRLSRPLDDDRIGSVKATLLLACVPFALGIGFVWAPFQYTRSIGVANGSIELRFLMPRAPVRYPLADVETVTLVETCQVTRAGWSTRSMLEIGMRSGARAEPIEGERLTLVALAERLRELTSVQPTYEARNRELAQGACVTESPW